VVIIFTILGTAIGAMVEALKLARLGLRSLE
jgi:hypothetical protein